MPEDSKVQAVYAARSDEELLRRYEDSAPDYDRDIEEDFGYLLPQAAARALHRAAPPDASVLDAGAGTGLVGEALQALGFRNVDAMDMSQAMLAVAAAKGVYRQRFEMRLGEPLGFRAETYDAVIAVGVLTLGHAPPEALDELTRVTRRGGHIVFSMRDDVYEERGFKAKRAALEQAGRWALVERSEPFEGLPKGEPGVMFRIWTFTIPERVPA